MCTVAALAMSFTSCGEKKPTNLDNVIEDGFYVVGEATTVASTSASNLNLALMGKGTNEVTKTDRAGMYEKYVYLQADKEFSLVLHQEGKTDVVYGANLEEKDAITDNDAEVKLKEYWGQLKTNATAKVPVAGLYHIILDLNLSGDLDNMGGAQIVVLPCEWGLRGWQGDWGFRGMEIVEQTATKVVYKYTPENGEDVVEAAGSFKFAHSNCWKFNLDMSGAVKAENSIGTDASEDGGAYQNLKNGGKNIPYARGKYDYVTLTWELKGGDVAKSFSFETHMSGTLDVANPAEYVVGISGSKLRGQDGYEVASWGDPAGYALAVYDKDASAISDQATLAGTYVYNITDLTFEDGSEFKLRYNGEWIGASAANVVLTGVNAQGEDNFSGIKGSYNIKFTVVWDGTKWTSIKAEFTPGQEPSEIPVLDPKTFSVGVSGEGLSGIANWAAPEGAAKADIDEAKTSITDQATLAGTYVYNITNLTFEEGSKFKLRFRDDWIGVGNTNVTVNGVTTSGADNFEGVVGTYNIVFTIVWDGSAMTSMTADFAEVK